MSENYEHDASGADEPDWFESNVVPFPARPSWIGPDGNPTQEWIEDYDRRHGVTAALEAQDGPRVVEGVVVNRADATPVTWKAWRAGRRAYRAAVVALRWLLAHRATRFGARQAA